MAPATKEDASKKRKSPGSASAASAPDRAALHAKVSKLEEEESRSRDAEQDAGLFAETVDQLKGLLTKAYDVKTKKTKAKAAEELPEMRVKASLHVLTLKRLNRLDKLRARDSRERTQAAKQDVDALHLSLQNLLYEAMHLQKEIARCRQFRSADEDIDLVDEEEFYRSASEEVKKKAAEAEGGEAAHKVRLARLEHEDGSRRELSEQLKELEGRRDKVEAVIKAKRDGLASLGPQLKTILDATRPTQEYLKMSLSKQWDQAKLCQALPGPLFVLYSQTSGYGEASDQLVSVEIVGDLEEARQFRASRLLAEDNDDDESNNATNEEEEEVPAKKSKRGKGGQNSGKQAMSKQEERLCRLLITHPLKVRVEIQLKRKENTKVILTFSHLSRLGVVAVKAKLEGDEASSTSAILQPATLLSHLLGSGDGGRESPNPANRFQLSEAGCAGGALPDKRTEELGVLYRWAQLMSGLVHHPQQQEGSEVVASTDVGFEHVPDIVKAIRSRVLARLSLQRQLAQLDRAKLVQVEPKVPQAAAGLFPEDAGGGGGKGSSRIRNWTSVDWEQYTGLAVTRHLVQSGAVSGEDYFFRLQVNRDPASLIALIAVKPDYPDRAPVFCLNLHWRGEHNLGNSEHIRALERAVNTGFDSQDDGDEEEDKHHSLLSDPECRSHLLSLQLKRLLTSLDAMLESWNAAERGDKVDFPRERAFLKTIGGRNRNLPLNYDEKQQIFTHR